MTEQVQHTYSKQGDLDTLLDVTQTCLLHMVATRSERIEGKWIVPYHLEHKYCFHWRMIHPDSIKWNVLLVDEDIMNALGRISGRRRAQSEKGKKSKSSSVAKKE